MIVDDSRRDVFSPTVYDKCVGGRRDSSTNGGDLSVLHQDGAISDQRSGGGQNIDVADYGSARWKRDVGTGKRIRVGERSRAAPDICGR